MQQKKILEAYPKTGDSGQGINVKEILMKYYHYLWLFILVIGIALTAAWLSLRYATPRYSVAATLMIRTENANRGNSNGGGEDMFADIALFQSNTNKVNEIEILKSRTMMERVVKSLGLNKAYYVKGSVKTTNIYKEQPFDLEIMSPGDSVRPVSLNIHFKQDGLETFTLNEDTRVYKMGEEIRLPQGNFKLVPRNSAYSKLPYRDYYVHWISDQDAAASFGGGLSIKPTNDLSNVLSISYITDNPRLGADIVNQLMIEYNDAGVEDKNETNKKIISFIDDRLAIVEKQLDSVEIEFQRYKTSKDVIDLTVQSQAYFGNLSQLEQNVQTQNIQLQVVNLLEDYLNDPKKRNGLVPSTLGITDPTLTELTSGYNALVIARQKESNTGATGNNPILQTLDNDIEEARKKILRSLANIKQVYQSTLASLENQTGFLKKEISSIPTKERESRERARQQEIKQNLYLYLLQKKEGSAIAKASTISNSRVIDKALPHYSQVSPVPNRVYSIALLAGLLIPIAIIYILDLLNDKVTTRADIAKVTDSPILAEIGHNDDGKVLLFPQKSRSVVAEQFRILRTNLRFILGDKFDNAVLLVTSSFSGEGKSFVSTNLGATFAISGKKTVILEFDLRKPKVVEGLGLQKSHGLTNFLVGAAKLEDLPQPVPEIENLWVIPCGPVPPNPSEILLTQRIADMFIWLRENFDTIVVDTAPVGLVSDSMALSQYADATLYIVRQRYTFKKQLQFVDELYREKKLPQLGLVVNDVKTEGARSYYGYGGGRYGYGYGYGYGYIGNSGYFSGSEGKKGFWNKTKRMMGPSKKRR